MKIKSVLFVLFIFIVLSSSNKTLAQPVSFDYSIQPKAREQWGIFPTKFGEHLWNNCNARNRIDLRIYENRFFLSPVVNPFASFSGGVKLGSNTIDSYGVGTCQGLYGYGTTKIWLFDNTPTRLLDTITISFSPKKVIKITIIGKTSQDYIITINDTISKNYRSPSFAPPFPPYRFQTADADLSVIGFTSAELSNVVKLSIKSVDTNWAFAINGILLSEPDNIGGGGTSPPPTQTVENPIVFVPGVGASELKEENAGVRWLSPSILTMGDDLEALNLPNVRNVFATDVFRGLPNQIYLSNLYPATFYDRLFTQLLNVSNIGSEYIIDGISSRRTTMGCDLSQDSSIESLKPKVFTFAYDWRKSNVETAVALKDYIGCVKRFHPNKKVRIIAHSMGGLVSRRYALDFPNDNNVDKIITIGTPWLGAPRGIHSLETGSFIATAFGSSPYECGSNTECQAAWAVNSRHARNLRSAMKTFTGPLQLLPSRFYYDLDFPNIPFSTRTFPWSNKVPLNYNETTDWLNKRHIILPGSISRDFHNAYSSLQDDWRSDSSSIKYYHIYGLQNSKLSVGKVNHTSATICNTVTLNCIDSQYFEPTATIGDGTVPLISSRRISENGYNLNSPNAKRYIENARNPPNGQIITDENAEHTMLTANPRVHQRILHILRNDDDYDQLDATVADASYPIQQNFTNDKISPAKDSSSYYVSLFNVDGFRFNQEGGVKSFSESSGPNGSQAIPIGDRALWIATPAVDSYSIAFYGNGLPIRIQILKGSDSQSATKFNHYIDLNIPSGSIGEIKLSQFDDPIVKYDSNGDGLPETDIIPTISINGNNAKDQEPPVLDYDLQTQGSGKLVTLSATDNHSGLRKIYYSFDGVQFFEYTNPIPIKFGQNLYAFAEDNNRNRTGITQFDTFVNTYSVGNRVWFDVNNDGKINRDSFPQEVGIENVSISIFADSNFDGQPDDLSQPLNTTTSTNEGYYRFDGMPSGSYVIRINPSNFADDGYLAGFLNTTFQTADDLDSDLMNAGENGILPEGARNIVQTVGVLSNSIVLGPELSEPQNELDVSADDISKYDRYSNLTVDFGFYRLSLSGTIWNDSGTSYNANNGIFDENEIGLANYRVKIYQYGIEIPVGQDGLFGTLDDSLGGILTNLDGGYTFQGLTEGDYNVKVNRQGGNSSTPTSNNPNDNVDFDDNGNFDIKISETQIFSSLVNMSAASRGLLENTKINQFNGRTENPTLDFGIVLSPSAAPSIIKGIVKDSNGRLIKRAILTLINIATNETKVIFSNQFGRFVFNQVGIGNFYILKVQHKHFVFAPITFQLQDDLTDLFVIGNPAY